MDDSEHQIDIEERIISYGFKYENYLYFPESFNENYLFYYMSKYNFLKLVKTFISMKKKEKQKHIDNSNIIDNKTLIEEAVKMNELYIVYDLLTKKNCICEQLFYECNQLIEMTIPKSIKSIDKCSFYECKALTIISIPSTVEIIGPYAFFGCDLLKEITIPSTVNINWKICFF